MHLHAARQDMAASRRFFAECLRLPVVAEGSASVSYRAADVDLVLDCTLDHAAAAAESDARSEVILLVDDAEAVRAALEGCGVHCTRTDPPAVTVPGGPRFLLLELTDACLMWPSAGWRAGPSAVARTQPRPATS
jgi:hypothetical protein